MNLFLVVVVAAALPTFDDFRRADQERRHRGEMQTAASLQLNWIDPELIARTAAQHPGDQLIQWGAAELFVDWNRKRTQFETAIKVGTETNLAIALRFGCVAAQHPDDVDLATRWLGFCEAQDPSNAVPWLVELSQPREKKLVVPPVAVQFYDYGAQAARARIALLEAAGYSKYAARRLGFVPDMPVLTVTRALMKQPPDKDNTLFLLSAARAMQQSATFVLTELVGQSLERSILSHRSDDEAADRLEKLVERREELTSLIRDIERGVAEQATESEMIRYFETVLTRGEENAMRRLSGTVRGTP